jgi:hypothetical protein
MTNCDYNPPNRKPMQFKFYYLIVETQKEVNVSFEFHTTQSALTFAEMPTPGMIFLRYERLA